MSTPTVIRHKTHKNLIAVVITSFDRHSQLVAAVQIYKTHETGGTALVRSFGEYSDEQGAIAKFDSINLEQVHYDQWYKEVALRVMKLCGMHPNDLPDYDYRIAYDDGHEPDEVALDAVEWAQSF